MDREARLTYTQHKGKTPEFFERAASNEEVKQSFIGCAEYRLPKGVSEVFYQSSSDGQHHPCGKCID